MCDVRSTAMPLHGGLMAGAAILPASSCQFWISFYGLPDNDKLRSLRSNKIGKLSQVWR